MADLPEIDALLARLEAAVTALRAEVERLRDRSYDLAVAIMGGEDVPGLADGTSTEALVAQARENERRHMQCIDREMRLTRERDEAREALAEAEEFRTAVYADAGKRPYVGLEEPEWNVDLFEVERAVAVRMQKRTNNAD